MNGYDKFKHQVWNMMEPDLCLQNGVLHRFPVIALEEMNEMSPHHPPRPPGPVGGRGRQPLISYNWL